MWAAKRGDCWVGWKDAKMAACLVARSVGLKVSLWVGARECLRADRRAAMKGKRRVDRKASQTAAHLVQ